jgi:hypothetical protein
MYHPIVACAAETGDMLDARLRPGNAHTAEGALGFVLDLVDRLEGRMCQVALVRMDAGFPEEGLLAGLEARGTPYVARIRNNRVLDRMAAPHLRRPPGRPPAEPRLWCHEMEYRAGAWSRPRRLVLVVLERAPTSCCSTTSGCSPASTTPPCRPRRCSPTTAGAAPPRATSAS